VAIYRFTVSCIDQRDMLCLQSLHGDQRDMLYLQSLHDGIFGVLSDVWNVCTI